MFEEGFTELDLSKKQFGSMDQESSNFSESPSYKTMEDIRNLSMPTNYVVKVTNPEKVGEGLSSYIVYHVNSKLCNDEYFVTRRFSDFWGLHEKLVAKYLSEGIIIPPAPTKDVIGTTKIRISKDVSVESEFVQRRRVALERFITRIVNHPILNKDPDVHEFLQNTEDSIRTTSNQLLSGVSAKKIMKNFGDAIGKFTYKVDDPNEFFYQKAEELDNWEKQIKRLYSSIVAMVSTNQDLASSKVNLSRSIFALAKEEENTTLAQTLHRLGETQEQLAHLTALEAESQFCFLVEHIRETLGMIQAAKDVLGERLRMFRLWKNAESSLRAKRESKVRMELAGKLDYRKSNLITNDLQELEDRVVESKQKFDDISANIRIEFESFEFGRFVYLKQVGIDCLEFMLQIQTKVLENWETYKNHVTCVH